jgi:hypothetical protein
MEEEPDFIRKLGRVTSLKLDMSDDPLLREDEFRILSGAAQTDVTSTYAAA